ncbi:MAG: helix-turn-helix domain-containing protein [Lascolabacillus sp.]|nr:helix-turn-helix domain-containing protein [Lascolabacillus sp.]
MSCKSNVSMVIIYYLVRCYIIINIKGGALMIAETIKSLRERTGITQTQLANKLNITRSSVNAWEMGISAPSMQYIVELANIFKVSTDYLLGVSNTYYIDVKNLNEEQLKIIYSLLNYFSNEVKESDDI